MLLKHHLRVFLTFCIILIAVAASFADEVEITPQPIGNTEPPAGAGTQKKITATLVSNVPGNIFLNGQEIVLTARIKNSGEACNITLVTHISSALGCVVFSEQSDDKIPENGELVRPIVFDGSSTLPNGAYLVEIFSLTDTLYASTRFSIWSGPAEKQCDFFGVSYHGPLIGNQLTKDMDLFKQAGIGWLRFPMQGWLPTGQETVAQAEIYNKFMQEAEARNFSLLAAFFPKITVDPGVNAIQANKEYQESLMAAAARYLFKIRHWELLRVPPPSNLPNLRGIGYEQISKGQQSLHEIDKKVQIIFTLDDPFKSNAFDLFYKSLPKNKNDIVGLRYDFIGIPENDGTSTTPALYALNDVAALAKQKLKRTPPFWVTEFGFDSSRPRLPKQAAYQAALISRALILSRIVGVERVFWRNDPQDQLALPLIAPDGSAQPSLLALRTTIQMLDGATGYMPISTPVAKVRNQEVIKAIAITYAGDKKAKTRTRYGLVMWSIAGPTSICIKANAAQLPMTDLWGNTIVLEPVAETAIFQVDEFPKFIDLGENKTISFLPAFAHFTPSRLQLYDGGKNQMEFNIWSDHRVLSDDIACKLRFTQFPGGNQREIPDFQILGSPAMKTELTIPKGARKGQHIYDMNVEIFIGSRRMGYLTLPVWYGDKPEDAR